mmetsp:Transcript_62206/g.151693  ORF Transcript_62206/g.151693 Transcript_62206/m.151693 type:complete len:124 (-) Transcript_62206:2001-2372(-)
MDLLTPLSPWNTTLIESVCRERENIAQIHRRTGSLFCKHQRQRNEKSIGLCEEGYENYDCRQSINMEQFGFQSYHHYVLVLRIHDRFYEYECDEKVGRKFHGACLLLLLLLLAIHQCTTVLVP